MKEEWDDCSTWTQALIIAYDQTRQHEELEEKKASAGGGKGKSPPRKQRRSR